MSVYVDTPKRRYGRMTCQMISDDTEHVALLTMAARKRMIRKGAIEVSRYRLNQLLKDRKYVRQII